MRINKYIASAGVCSRRKADELIEQGKVKVNGTVLRTPGYEVQDGDSVEVEGSVLKKSAKHHYYMLNKPVGYITAMSDERGRATVADLMGDIPYRVFPIGRLDNNSSGLLIMTDDGELAHKIMSPSFGIVKTYVARVTGLLRNYEAEKLRRGVDIGGYVTQPAEVEIILQSDTESIAVVKISEGKNRQVRRMFKAVGHEVIALDRIAIGDLKMAHLKPGGIRKLTENEVAYLKRL